MSTEAPALARAVAEAAERPLGFMPDAVQLNLLREENGGRIDASGLRHLRTGPGRRAGSRNKRTEKTAKLIVQRYGDPLDALGNFARMPIEDATAMVRHADDPDGDDIEQILHAVNVLARGLSDESADAVSKALIKWLSRKQISALDVLAMQVRVQQDLMTYVHGRQPVSVNVTEKTDAVVIIPGINAPTNVPQQQIADAINQRGLDAIDFESMTLIAPPVDAEFAEVGEDADAE